MPYYALFYDVVDNFISRRLPYGDEHLRLAREARARGHLVLAGALANPADRALLVFRTEDPGIVEEFARNDPYVINGLVSRWEVRPWSVVIGDEPEAQKTSGTGELLTRLWTATAREHDSRAYLRHFSQAVIPVLRQCNGYAGAVVLTREPATEQVEIVVATAWKSMAAIREFAGEILTRPSWQTRRQLS
jgi:uncharacterized protein YciI